MFKIDDWLNSEDENSTDKYLDEIMKKRINEQLRDMFIGYIDINGLQYKMQTMKNKDFQNLCNGIAEVVENIIIEIKSFSEEPLISKNIKFHMFSDNMIFLCDDLQFLIEWMGLIQRSLAVQMQLTIKGGIDQGSIYYYKDKFVLGKGLVSAYNIDRDYHNPAINISRKLITKDLRGVKKVGFDEYVVDYYSIAESFSEDFWIEEIDRIKDMIETNLAQKFPENVLHKYIWLKEYHNQFCRTKNKNQWIIK